MYQNHENILKINFRYQDSSIDNDATEIESLKALDSGITTKIIPLPNDVPKDHPFYVQITGRSEKGNSGIIYS